MGKCTVKEYFINQLKSRNSDISKEDILNCALEFGLDIKQRMAKDKIIDILVEQHFDRFFNYFQEFITIPEWEVADYYNIATNKIGQLKTIGAIKEDPILKEFYSRSNHEYFNAATYPLSVLNYDRNELVNAYDNAFGGDMYSLRIETKTKDEVSGLINVLEKVFKIEKAPASYEHRNGDGYYSYFKVKLLNNSTEEENFLLSEISKLKKEKQKVKDEKEEVRREYQERIEKIFSTLEGYLGEGLNNINLESRLKKLINNKEE